MLAACLLTACAGCATTAHDKQKSPSPQVPLVFTEPTADRVADSTIARQALQKAYYIGRIVDPNYPELLHGDGVVYRRERAAGWNLQGAAARDRGEFMSGPIRSMPNGSETPGMTTADVEIHEARTSAIVDALLEQNAELADKLTEMSQTPPSVRPAPDPSTPNQPSSSTPPSHAQSAPRSEQSSSDPELVTIAPSADNIIELSPALLEPPIPGLTNPFRQRYHFETQLRETKVLVSGIALGPQPSCVLGERICNIGDIFETFTIAGIDADGIFLRKESFLLRIPMQDAPVLLRYP